ncbi:hypothetical protein IFM89_003812 [Coptis chinensis]|uniref:Uncharacterized protein n=1 Tax=Coptis chinensis TaxID=261450 RepID=A0A835LLL0_9MAGN|nr:hypothetical protein IFM89_003812 [Coptis chinensis]
MEESENRKERLRAMRIAAAANAQEAPSTIPTNLFNPLAETSTTNMPGPQPPARFDFYTDPMAAFSGNRTKSQKLEPGLPNYGPLPGPRNLDTTPPTHQFNQSYSSNQRTYEAPFPYSNPGPWRSPIGMARPFPQQLGTPPAVWNRPGDTGGCSFLPNSPIGGGFPSPDFGQRDSSNPGRSNGVQYSNSSNPGFGRGDSPNPGRGNSVQYSNSSNPGFGRGDGPNFGRGDGVQYSNSPNPGFGQGGIPYPYSGRGSGLQFSNRGCPGWGRGGSPSPNAGRSSGYRFGSSSSPGSGRGGGRGRGFHGHVSARESPELFYNKSMLEDPWRFLKPVVREITVSEETSWLPKSISRKDIVPKAATVFPSGSIAELVAASLKEVNNDINIV